VGKFAGIFAAIGLALGAIGTAVASVLTGFMQLRLWQMPLAVLGLLLVISGPSMVIAYLKLRHRNLAPLLDANGWAVNTKAMINLPFGTSLTDVAALPPGAQRSLRDPYVQRRMPWRLYAILTLALILFGYLWEEGYLSKWRDQVTTRVEQAVQQVQKPAGEEPKP
jgi:MFS family permease